MVSPKEDTKGSVFLRAEGRRCAAIILPAKYKSIVCVFVRDRCESVAQAFVCVDVKDLFFYWVSVLFVFVWSRDLCVFVMVS